MNRQIATILAFIVAVLPAYIGAGEDPPEESAQQRNESDAIGKTALIRLADGSEIEVVSIRISSGYVMLTLPNGGQVAYGIRDVDPESLPRKPETKSLIDDEASPRETAMGKFGEPETKSLIDVEAPRRETALNKYASALKPIDSRSQPLIKGTYQQLPTARVSPEGSTAGTQPSTDAASDYMESLIAAQEEEHQQALQLYEAQIQQLAYLGMEAARAWNRASAACEGGTFFGGQGYGIVANSWESWTVDVRYNGWIDNSSTPACRAMVADAAGLARALASGLNQMGGVARKSGVLPGEARRIMNSYGFRN